MLKKVYEQMTKILKENYIYIFFLIAFYFVLTIPLPYYIHTEGGLIDVSDKVNIENEYSKEGSINLSYVTEMRGTVLTYLLSFVIPGWDLVSQENYVSNNETYEDSEYRNHMLLEEANAHAMMVAYREAKKEVIIKEHHFHVVYVAEEANTSLKIGDEIVSVDGVQITSLNDYIKVVSKNTIGSSINVTVINDDKKLVEKQAKVFERDGKHVTGIIITSNYVYDANPDIEFNFKQSESGPSGGLMMALAIYNKLVTEDLTKGLTIVGTGTIDVDGNVGQISGIQYKMKGAVKEGADIFLVPLGENYEDAKKEAEKYNYSIKVVGISTFTDAINYLRSV